MQPHEEKNEDSSKNFFLIFFTVKFQGPVTAVFNDIINLHNDLMFIFIFILSIILTLLTVIALVYSGLLSKKVFGYANTADSHQTLETI
jgi:hypothetical protein